VAGCGCCGGAQCQACAGVPVPAALFLTGAGFPSAFAFLNGTFPFNVTPPASIWAIPPEYGGYWAGVCQAVVTVPPGEPGSGHLGSPLFFQGGSLQSGQVLFTWDYAPPPRAYEDSCSPLLVRVPSAAIVLRRIVSGVTIVVPHSATVTVSE
jgi:hypothetical protein